MPYRMVTLTEYRRRIAGTEQDGMSPGGVARRLGISRQAVNYAIQRGDLDAFRLHDREGNVLATVVTEASVKAYRPRAYPRRA